MSMFVTTTTYTTTVTTRTMSDSASFVCEKGYGEA